MWTKMVPQWLCVMAFKKAASDSIGNCVAQSWDYLSQGCVSTAVLTGTVAECVNLKSL